MNNRQLVKQNYGHPSKVNQGETTRQEILSDLSDDALRFMRNKHAKNTQNAYQSDARVFTEWCFLNDIEPEKSSTSDIANFLSDQASGELCRWEWSDKANRIGSLVDGDPLAHSTIYRRWNGVKFALKQRGRIFLETELDVIKEVMQGIASEVGTEKKKVRGIRPDDLKLIFSTFDLTNHIDLRDRALLMLLFAGAFRRSEISALLVRNVKIYDVKPSVRKTVLRKRYWLAMSFALFDSCRSTWKQLTFKMVMFSAVLTEAGKCLKTPYRAPVFTTWFKPDVRLLVLKVCSVAIVEDADL